MYGVIYVVFYIASGTFYDLNIFRAELGSYYSTQISQVTFQSHLYFLLANTLASTTMLVRVRRARVVHFRPIMRATTETRVLESGAVKNIILISDSPSHLGKC